MKVFVHVIVGGKCGCVEKCLFYRQTDRILNNEFCHKQGCLFNHTGTNLSTLALTGGNAKSLLELWRPRWIIRDGKNVFFFAFKKVIMRRQNKLKLILLFFPSSVNFSSDWFTRFSLLLPAWYWLPWVSPYDALAFKSVVISVSKKTERWWALLLEEIKIPFRISSACASKLWRVLLRKHTGETPFAGHLPSTS